MIRHAAFALACLCLVPAQAHGESIDEVPGRQAVAAILTPHEARRAPDTADAVTAVVPVRRPLTGTRTVLPVLADTVDAQGRTWLRVRLPGRALWQRGPPPTTGWIRAAGTHRSVIRWRLVVDLSARRVDVERDGTRQRSFRAIVGRPSTPTPQGTFFVEENVRLPSHRVGAPFALALSARSGVLREFDGGPGQIAIHGRGNVGGRPGTAVSHGCIRLGTTAITWLGHRIPPGTPVTVVR